MGRKFPQIIRSILDKQKTKIHGGERYVGRNSKE